MVKENSTKNTTNSVWTNMVHWNTKSTVIIVVLKNYAHLVVFLKKGFPSGTSKLWQLSFQIVIYSVYCAKSNYPGHANNKNCFIRIGGLYRQRTARYIRPTEMTICNLVNKFKSTGSINKQSTL